ncbi:hypothetical protein K1T71_009050, partial [Dendrolimus kikuchii]
LNLQSLGPPITFIQIIQTQEINGLTTKLFRALSTSTNALLITFLFLQRILVFID